MRLILRTGGGALLCVAALLGNSASAHARPAADPLGFGIQAVGHRSHFLYKMPPGRTVRGAVRIQSTSDRARTVFLQAASATTAATGGLAYGTRGVSPRGPGRWIRLARSRVVVPAQGTVDVPFTARVPRRISEGDKLAGIVAFGTPPRPRATGKRGFRLRFVSRLATAVQFRVPGRLTRALALRAAGIHVAPAGATLGLELASTGNALIPRTTGTVRVLKEGRELFTEAIEIGSFVPGTAITYPVAWPDTPAEGVYEIRGTLHPEGGPPVDIDRTVRFDQGRIEQYRRETGRPAVNEGDTPILVSLAAMLAAGIAGLVGGRVRYRSRVDRRGV